MSPAEIITQERRDRIELPYIVDESDLEWVVQRLCEELRDKHADYEIVAVPAPVALGIWQAAERGAQSFIEGSAARRRKLATA